MATGDFHKLTEDELEKFISVFRGLPSYDDSGEEPRISSNDFPLLFTRLGIDRNPVQLKAYKDYADSQMGGYVLLSKYITGFSTVYKASKFAKLLAEPYDKNGDGYISADEFDDFLRLMVVHEPKLKEMVYSKFVQEADKNKDGKVSVQEFANWIRETMNEYDSC